MNPIMTLAAAAALGLGVAATAFAAEDRAAPAAGPSAQAAVPAMSDSDIRNQLAIDGYTVQSMKRNGDKVSIIAANKDGTTSKLRVDAQSGQVTQAGDDDGDDDDD